MKKIQKKYFKVLMTLLILSGCDTDTLHDRNIDPQAVTEINVNYIFTAAELSMASNGGADWNRYLDWRTNIGLCASAIQQITTMEWSATRHGNFYIHAEQISSGAFEFIYSDQLKNISEIITQTGEGGFAEGRNKNTREAARIMRALSYFRLTDYYGAIPYFNANQGMDGNFFPVYDNQSAIYPDLLKELHESVNTISSSNPDEGFKDADMIFHGDISKWKKWGNSLMLRYAMRASNVDLDLANTYVTLAVEGGVFEGNDENVWVPMATGPGKWMSQNGISRAFIPGDGGNPSWLSQTLINFLKGADPDTVEDDDPRLMILSGGIAIWNQAGWEPVDMDPLNQLGVPPGYYQSEVEAILNKPGLIPDETFSRINYLMLDVDDPYMIMNYAEVEFLLAEALERGIGTGIPGTAQEHYDAGVKASMQMYTPYDASLAISDGDVEAYLTRYPYGGGGVTGNENPLEQIGWQMWVSKFFNWWDAWCDWRRTDYPPLVPHTSHIAPVTGGTIPVRLPYPNNEVIANPNFNQGEYNNYTSPVWWDGGTE
jgi:hypothetical protein